MPTHAKRTTEAEPRLWAGPAYTIESRTTAGKAYVVLYDPARGVATCTCPAGANGRKCWHVEAVLDGREQPEAPLTAVAAPQHSAEGARPPASLVERPVSPNGGAR